MKKIVKWILKKLGYQINKYDENRVLINRLDWTPFKEDNENHKLYKVGIKKSGEEWTDEFSKQLRFHSLIQIVKKVLSQDKVFDFAECGCWRGHSSYIISRLIQDANKDIKFHIFDSFEGGLSVSTPEDKDFYLKDEKHKTWMTKHFASSESFVKDTVLKEFSFVKTYNGWIPERFKEVDDKSFSLVHVDVDLFAPTFDTVDFFFPRLVKGGAIICDDYNSSQFPGAKDAWDKYFKHQKFDFFYESPFGGCFIIK